MFRRFATGLSNGILKQTCLGKFWAPPVPTALNCTRVMKLQSWAFYEVKSAILKTKGFKLPKMSWIFSTNTNFFRSKNTFLLLQYISRDGKSTKMKNFEKGFLYHSTTVQWPFPSGPYFRHLGHLATGWRIRTCSARKKVIFLTFSYFSALKIW